MAVWILNAKIFFPTVALKKASMQTCCCKHSQSQSSLTTSSYYIVLYQGFPTISMLRPPQTPLSSDPTLQTPQKMLHSAMAPRFQSSANNAWKLRQAQNPLQNHVTAAILVFAYCAKYAATPTKFWRCRRYGGKTKNSKFYSKIFHPDRCAL